MGSVHPSSTIGPDAEIVGAEIGPNCLIEGRVVIGAGTTLGPGCLIRGPATIGAENKFHGYCVLDASQDKKRDGEGGSLVMGEGNDVREFTTLHRATGPDAVTTIGNGNLFMPYSHVAHDCKVGDGTVLANLVQLGGDVSVHDKAILGGGVLVHQSCRIGTLAIVGGGTSVRQDVPPYAKYAVLPTKISVGVNTVGLARAGMKDFVGTVTTAYRMLYREGLTLKQATDRIREMAGEHDCLAPLSGFLDGVGASGLVRPRRMAFSD